MNPVGKRALVTGSEGFCGKHLVHRLRKNGWETIGIDVAECDIQNIDAVKSTLSSAQPDVVFHLAGIAYPPEAQAKPALAWSVNAAGTCNILSAGWARPKRPRIVLVSSSYVVYGNSDIEDHPIDESAPLAPKDNYSAGKAAAEMIAQEWVQRGLDVVIARPFNHIGPGQREDFVAAAFSYQIARIEAGLMKDRLRVGNLDAERDLSDVRDVAAAYELLAEKGEAGRVYNVCSGKARPIRAILEGLLDHARCRIHVETDPERLRPSEHARLVGDPSRIMEELGWAPQITFEKSLEDILNDARQAVKDKDASQ